MKLLPRFSPLQQVAADYGCFLSYDVRADTYNISMRRVLTKPIPSVWLKINRLLLHSFRGDPRWLLAYTIENAWAEARSR